MGQMLAGIEFKFQALFSLRSATSEPAPPTTMTRKQNFACKTHLSRLCRSSAAALTCAPTERANGNKRLGPLSRWGQLPAPNALAGGRSLRRRADPLPLDLNLDLSQCQRRRRRISRCRSSDSFARPAKSSARAHRSKVNKQSRKVFARRCNQNNNNDDHESCNHYRS